MVKSSRKNTLLGSAEYVVQSLTDRCCEEKTCGENDRSSKRLVRMLEIPTTRSTARPSTDSTPSNIRQRRATTQIWRQKQDTRTPSSCQPKARCFKVVLFCSIACPPATHSFSIVLCTRWYKFYTEIEMRCQNKRLPQATFLIGRDKMTIKQDLATTTEERESFTQFLRKLLTIHTEEVFSHSHYQASKQEESI